MQEILVHSYGIANRLDLFEKQFISRSIHLDNRKRVLFTLRRLVFREKGLPLLFVLSLLMGNECVGEIRVEILTCHNP